MAWPGREYVDYVGVDAYDISYSTYHAGEAPTNAQQQTAVAELLNGRWGLWFWAHFAAHHGRPLAIPEWGLTWLADGHGGRDDITYVLEMFQFFDDPAANVAYACYFNAANVTADHRMTGHTRFPRARAAYTQHVREQSRPQGAKFPKAVAKVTDDLDQPLARRRGRPRGRTRERGGPGGPVKSGQRGWSQCGRRQRVIPQR